MAENNPNSNFSERRSELRKEVDRLFGAEIKLLGVPIHRFKFKDLSTNGACILIKEDSNMMNHLKAGQILNMRYYSPNNTDTPTIRSEIKHITKAEQGRFKGHYLIGVFISEKLNLA
jgi:hypothetical protein